LTKHKNSMLAAAFKLGIPIMPTPHKEEMRQLAMTRWEFSAAERRDLLAYCAEDVGTTSKIFEALAPEIQWSHALLHGRYGLAVARMEHEGAPIDTDRWSAVQEAWPALSRGADRRVDQAYGVFQDGKKSDRLILKMAAERGIHWPLTPTGKPHCDTDTMKELAGLYPELNDLKELLGTLNQSKMGWKLAIGRDGRNRTGLIPFQAVTGRNQPSSSKFIFGPATWLRSFIRAEPGETVIYFDWSGEEIAIAAAKSGDERLIADYRSGDPYIAFAVRHRGRQLPRRRFPRSPWPGGDCARAMQRNAQRPNVWDARQSRSDAGGARRRRPGGSEGWTAGHHPA
jgi:hypothetical protein